MNLQTNKRGKGDPIMVDMLNDCRFGNPCESTILYLNTNFGKNIPSIWIKNTADACLKSYNHSIREDPILMEFKCKNNYNNKYHDNMGSLIKKEKKIQTIDPNNATFKLWKNELVSNHGNNENNILYQTFCTIAVIENDEMIQMNEHYYSLLTTSEHILLSTDNNDGNFGKLFDSRLQTIQTKTGLLTELKLKKYAICIFSTNVPGNNVIVHNARCRVEEISNDIIQVKLFVNGILNEEIIDIHKHTARGEIQYNNQTINFSRTQFPLTLGYCGNVFSLQGLTLSKLLIVSTRLSTVFCSQKNPYHLYDGCGYLYTLLTRCQNHEDIICMNKIHQTDFKVHPKSLAFEKYHHGLITTVNYHWNDNIIEISKDFCDYSNEPNMQHQINYCTSDYAQIHLNINKNIKKRTFTNINE